MSPVTRPAVRQPDMADEAAVKSWLDALAGGSCDVPAFLRVMQHKCSSDPDGNWEVLSQLDQYFRLGRIDSEAFKTIKTALSESALGVVNAQLGPARSAAQAAPIAHAVPAAIVPASRAVPIAREAPVSRAIPVAREAPVSLAIPVAWEAPMPRAVPMAREAPMKQNNARERREDTRSIEAVAEPKPGSLLRGRYRIEAVVAQGSTGTVFQVIDEFRLETAGSQRLALKVLHPAIAKRAELLAELPREFQSLQLLSHPNIVRVFEFDRDGPLVFFTMELLTGAPLSSVLQRVKLLPLERAQAMALIRDIGAALAYAHSRGVVHGDLNPKNVFITGPGELRVLGFGGSHKARQAATMPDHDMMLPIAASGYASCQVLEGDRADARDDVFALACIAYLLLSGDHPFANRTAVEARGARLKLRRPANLSGRQWQALRAGLRWEREHRPADVQQWLTQLELGGAARRLAPLADLLDPPPRKKSKSVLATGVAAGVLLAGAYWIVSHRDMLLDSPAPVYTPATPPAPPTSIAGPSVSAAPTTIPSPPTDRGNQPSVAASPTIPSATPSSTPISLSTSRKAPLAAIPLTPTHLASPAASPVGAPAAEALAGASKVELAADTVEVPAGEPSAQVTVHRRGSLRGETKFTWWTESGTAKPGADFSAVVPQRAYIGDGKSNVSLSIPLRNAPRNQSKSFFVVIDQSEGGARMGARTLTMVSLLPKE